MVSAARLAANRRSLASAIGAGIITPGAGGGVLGPLTASFTAGAQSGTLIAAITGLATGETIATIAPNDGRLALDGTRRNLLVGLSAATAGTIAATLTTSVGRTLAMTVVVADAGAIPQFGLISATADGSTGQTYTLNAAWTGVQWYRMALAKPNTLTAITGATGLTYVAKVADEGSRLVAIGMDGAVQKGAKALHVVLKPPVILEDFESSTGWVAGNNAVLSLATDAPATGTKRLQVAGTGTANAQATKVEIGNYDTSTLGTIVALGDLSMDAGHPGGVLVTLRKGGADAANLNFGALYETPTPLAIGKLWGALHVSENAMLAASGGAVVGLKVVNGGQIPYAKVAKFDALLGRAGGRPTVNINFDDNKATQYTVAYPLMKSLGLVADVNNVRSTSSNPSAFNLPKLQDVYANGWDIGLDSTDNDDITSSFGTMALAAASWQRGKDYAVAQGLTRGNEHGCWTGGQIEAFPNPGPAPSNRILATAVTSDGTTDANGYSTLNIAGATAYPSGSAPTVGMRVTGFNVPDSPNTRVMEVISASQVKVNAAIPAQTKPMYFVDDSSDFYTMKLPVYYRDVLGMKTMRTTRQDGGMFTRFGFADRGMFAFGVALHSLTLNAFKALLDLVQLRGLTVFFYTHGIIPGGGGVESDETIFTQQMQELAARQDAGALDVMTRSQIWARDGNATIPANLSPPETVLPAGARFISGSAANNTPPAPTGHQAGDLLLAFAYRDGAATVPTLPSGWTEISSAAGNNNAFLLAYKIAASGSETIDAFTGATNTLVHCYRGASASPIGNVSPAATAASGTVNIPAASWSLQATNGKSVVAYFGGSRSPTSGVDEAANRIGHTNATSGSDAGGFDTYGAVSAVSDLNLGASGAQQWYAVAVEIKAS